MDTQPRDTIGRFDEKPNSAPEVTLGASGVDTSILDAALEPYGLTLSDVPLDHEGRSLEDRFREIAEAAALPDLPTLDSDLQDQLGHPNYGRHRGGPYPVWWDPNLGPNDDDQAKDLNALTREEAEAQGLILLADVHTRNGGGNRECYNCPDYGDGPDGHDDDCLAGVIEKLQEHPAYHGDWDNDFDYTYADFYFRIDPDRTFAAYETDREALRRTRARAALKALKKGDIAPWDLFPTNPDTAAEIERLSEQADKARGRARLATEKLRRLPEDAQLNGVVRAEHGSDLDGAIAYLEGRADSFGKFPGSRWHKSFPYDNLTRRRRDDAVKYATEREKAVETRRALAEDSLSPTVRSVLEAALTSPTMGLKYAEQRAEQAEADVAKHLVALRTARALLDEPLKQAAVAGDFAERASALRRVRTWPGDPSAAPAPAPTQTATEPASSDDWG